MTLLFNQKERSKWIFFLLLVRVGDTVGPGDYDPQLCRNKSAINFGKGSTRKRSKNEII